MGLCCPLLLLLFSLFLPGIISNEQLHAWPSLALNDLSPPPGNSLLLKLQTRNGTQKYGCFGKKWQLLSATAELVDAANLAKAGSFRNSHYNRSSAGSWVLLNTREEFAESGHRLSEVSGAVVAIEESGQEGSSDMLVEAIEHKYSGRASLVSYIQVLSTKVEAPVAANCGVLGASNATREVGFETEYRMWAQDRKPPVETPAEVLAPFDKKLVEGFFAKGTIDYVYDGMKWVERDWKAKLYNVPGGDLVGHHRYMQAKAGANNDSESESVWEFLSSGGSGFGMNGTLERRVQVAENCLAWSLFVVTNSWGNLPASLGPFSHVQMVSTRGGASPPPLDSSSSPLEPSSPVPAAGEIYNSTFSSVFWFYANSY